MDINEIKLRAGIIEHNLDESSPGRVLQHIQDAKPFFVISPEREYRNDKQNQEAMKALKHHLGKADVGFFEQQGEWDGVPEKSIFVLPRRDLNGPDLKMFRKYAEKMMKKFDQKAIVFSDGDKIVFINQDGSVDDYDVDSVTFDKSKIDDIGGHSKLKSTPYAFSQSDPTDRQTVSMGKRSA